MVDKIEFEWSEIGIKARATLLKREEPGLCDTLWKNLKNPLKMFCRHPVSTGYTFFGEGRPPRHPVESGTQASPVGMKREFMTRVKPGDIVYSVFGGYGGISVFYGACTEPLPTGGSVIARVGEGDMDDLVKAGKYVWNAQYVTHLPAIMIVKRSE